MARMTALIIFVTLGERVGAATILCSSEEEKKAVESQMKIILDQCTLPSYQWSKDCY